MQTPAFHASSTTARSAFMGLAAAITFGLLGSIGAVADQRFEQAQLAQAAAPQHLAATAPAPHG